MLTRSISLESSVVARVSVTIRGRGTETSSSARLIAWSISSSSQMFTCEVSEIHPDLRVKGAARYVHAGTTILLVTITTKCPLLGAVISPLGNVTSNSPR